MAPVFAPGQGTPPKKRRWLRGCLLSAAVFIGVLALACGAWALNIRSQEKALETRIAVLVEETQRSWPRVPDEQNGALAYANALALLKDGGKLDQLMPSLRQRNADFKSAEVEAFLEANREYLQAVEKAAALPGYSLNPDFSRGVEVKQQERKGLKEAITFLRVAARHDAQSGNQKTAADKVRAIFGIAAQVGQEELFIGRIMGRASEGVGAMTLESVMNDCQLRNEDVDSLLRLLEKGSRNERSLAPALKASKVESMVSAPRFFRGEIWLEDTPSSEKKEMARYFRLIRWSGLAYSEIDNLARSFNELGKVLEREDPQQINEVFVKEQARPAMENLREHSVLAHIERTFGLLAVLNSHKGLARFRMARLALLCEKRKLEAGSYPPTMSERAPEYRNGGGGLPVDPFSRKPFLYERTAYGFRIWSVGPDFKDDGGDAEKDLVFEREPGSPR